MQNEQTLIELGFSRHKDWDSEDGVIQAFRLVSDKIFRAHVVDCNGPTYVCLGEVVTNDGKVKRWMDCGSAGSVARKINCH